MRTVRCPWIIMNFFFAKEDYKEFNIKKWVFIFNYLIQQTKCFFAFISMTKIINAFIVLL